MPLIDIGQERMRENHDRVAKLMQYVRTILTLDEDAMNEGHEIRESHIITIQKPKRPALYDDDEPTGSPIREETRHITFTEKQKDLRDLKPNRTQHDTDSSKIS